MPVAGLKWNKLATWAVHCARHSLTTKKGIEPLRASGKVLMADKVLTVAAAAGAAMLGDRAWLADFARATSAALARPVVRVDVQSMTINY